jgi:hypothetical protein
MMTPKEIAKHITKVAEGKLDWTKAPCELWIEREINEYAQREVKKYGLANVGKRFWITDKMEVRLLCERCDAPTTKVIIEHQKVVLEKEFECDCGPAQPPTVISEASAQQQVKSDVAEVVKPKCKTCNGKRVRREFDGSIVICLDC